MILRVCLLLILFSVAIIGCSCLADSGSGSSAQSPINSGGSAQDLSVVDANLASHPLKIMIARTEEERRQGLMFRRSLASDEGMLFCFNSPQIMVFWMKNTFVPLDLICFSPDLTVLETIEGMKPGVGIPDTRLPRYRSSQEAQYVLELASGSVKNLGIKPGDSLIMPLPLLFSE